MTPIIKGNTFVRKIKQKIITKCRIYKHWIEKWDGNCKQILEFEYEFISRGDSKTTVHFEQSYL